MSEAGSALKEQNCFHNSLKKESAELEMDECGKQSDVWRERNTRSAQNREQEMKDLNSTKTQFLNLSLSLTPSSTFQAGV